jgi:hypothetical protein
MLENFKHSIQIGKKYVIFNSEIFNKYNRARFGLFSYVSSSIGKHMKEEKKKKQSLIIEYFV